MRNNNKLNFLLPELCYILAKKKGTLKVGSMLKAELHTHINIDPQDRGYVRYSAYELIDHAAEAGFDVLGITCHNYVYTDTEVRKYALSKGIILITGMEMDLQGKHTLIYNITNEEARQIKTFHELSHLKEKLAAEGRNIFIIAAHPFHYAPICLKGKVIEHLNLFDAWEYSFFHCRLSNPNKKTVRLAGKFNKPLVGSSDVHLLKDLGRTYTLIDSLKDETEIFNAIRKNNVKVVSRPLSISEFIKISSRALISWIKKSKRAL